MRSSVVLASVALALALAAPLATEARADSIHQKQKATKASVVVLRTKLAAARDAIRALADTPAPKALTPAQAKTYAAEMAKVRELTDGTDAVVTKIDDQIDKVKADLDSMSEMGETESLRLQMAMDRLSKAMTAISNLLKKHADTAQSIVQNLK